MKAFLISTAPTIALFLVIFLTYLFLIAGRLRSPSMKEFFGLYAHRGLFSNTPPFDKPENSIPAFRSAVEHGFGIELDVHISSDGELFVFHDDNIKRMCGQDRLITSLSSAEIEKLRLLSGGESIPRFSDVLKLVGGKVPLIIELKCSQHDNPEPLCRAVSDMLSDYRGIYCIESFNTFVVEWFKKNRSDVFRGQLSEQFFSKNTIKGSAAARLWLESLTCNILGRPDFVAYNYKHKSSFSLVLWRRLMKRPTAFWTVRDEETLRKLYNDGKSCVIFEGFVPSSDFKGTGRR